MLGDHEAYHNPTLTHDHLPQDATSAVKYTDIDYVVFTDAARCLVSPALSTCARATGPLSPASIGDPYSRATYRYTPLLALILTPNILMHPAFGKVLFSACDLLIAVLLHDLILRRGRSGRSGPTSSATATKIVSIVWLLNPIIANISTRGSAESVLGVLVVAALAAAEAAKWDQAAVWFGLAVHFKVYPIIYGASIYAAISSGERGWGRWMSVRHVRFGIVSGAVFGALNAVMYAVSVARASCFYVSMSCRCYERIGKTWLKEWRRSCDHACSSARDG